MKSLTVLDVEGDTTMSVRSQSLKPIFSSDGSIIGYAQKTPRRGLVTYDENFDVIGGARTAKCARMLALMQIEEPAPHVARQSQPLAEPLQTRSMAYRRPTAPFGSDRRLDCVG